jgi:hypothetical protein
MLLVSGSRYGKHAKIRSWIVVELRQDMAFSPELKWIEDYNYVSWIFGFHSKKSLRLSVLDAWITLENLGGKAL